MKKFLAATLILVLPTVAHAEYKCMIESFGGYSQVRTMESFDTLSQAENTVKNYVIEKPQLVNRSKGYNTVSLYSAFLICFDKDGEAVLSTYYRSEPNCEISSFTGSFDCEDFVLGSETQ